MNIYKLADGYEQAKRSADRHSLLQIQDNRSMIVECCHEILLFNENTIVQGFTINSCDISTFAVSTGIQGHRKINILDNLLVRSRGENLYKLTEQEPENWEERYKKSFNYNYVNLAEEQMQTRYNEILAIINHDIVKKKNKNITAQKQLYTCKT